MTLYAYEPLNATNAFPKSEVKVVIYIQIIWNLKMLAHPTLARQIVSIGFHLKVYIHLTVAARIQTGLGVSSELKYF